VYHGVPLTMIYGSNITILVTRSYAYLVSTLLFVIINKYRRNMMDTFETIGLCLLLFGAGLYIGWYYTCMAIFSEDMDTIRHQKIAFDELSRELEKEVE